MRIIYIFLIGLGAATSLFAQDEQMDAVETNQVAGAAAETNAVVNSKVSFLVDTGIQYADEGEYEEAERAYLRALDEDPENVVIKFRLSTLYLQTDRYSEAVPILEALAEDYPENPQVRNNLSWAYATGPRVKNTEKALRNAREAILSSPFSPSMWNTLAEAYYTGGDYDRALRSSEQAIDLLIQTDPESDSIESFQAQRQKILRAQQAFKRFDGLFDDE